MGLRDEFIKRIEDFMAQWGYTPSEFSRAALGDAAFFAKLKRKNRRPNLNTVQRVNDWMSQGGDPERAKAVHSLRRRPVPSASTIAKRRDGSLSAKAPIEWSAAVDRVIRLGVAEDWSWHQIAAAVGVSRGSVRRHAADLGLVKASERYRRHRPRPAPPIDHQPMEVS